MSLIIIEGESFIGEYRQAIVGYDVESHCFCALLVGIARALKRFRDLVSLRQWLRDQGVALPVSVFFKLRSLERNMSSDVLVWPNLKLKRRRSRHSQSILALVA